MKAKIIPIEVDKSSLYKVGNGYHYDQDADIVDPEYVPILAVLVSDDGTEITQDTEELYEQLASGKLEFDRRYLFDTGNCDLSCSPSDWSTEGKCGANGCYGNKLSRPLRVVETPKAPTDEELRNTLIAYTESIRDYEHEAGHSIHNDDRDSSEFVDIWLRDQMLSSSEKPNK